LTFPAQESEAIRVHSEQATLFRSRYDELARDPYRSSFSYSRHRLHYHLDRLLPAAARPARLLDLGCGTGHYLGWARSRGYEVTGTDGSEAMLAEARSLVPGATLQLAPADALPFPDASFDAALCIEVFRYLPDVSPCIRELARVLRPGGICLATASPLLNMSAFPLLNRIALWLPLPVVRLKQFFHTSWGLGRRFRAAGFGEVAAHGVYLGPPNWVGRLSPRRLPGLLRALEPFDAAVSDLPIVRDLSAMILIHATR
jgi:ubiquinone/menaquinone biosynthesis C-methylase UbiE